MKFFDLRPIDIPTITIPKLRYWEFGDHFIQMVKADPVTQSPVISFCGCNRSVCQKCISALTVGVIFSPVTFTLTRHTYRLFSDGNGNKRAVPSAATEAGSKKRKK